MPTTTVRCGNWPRQGHDASEILASLVTADIADACDVLRPVWEWSEGGDGFVSVEVSPGMAQDVEGTIAEARQWVKRIDRANLLVKVPATRPGVEAVRRLISEGISINVTLIFSLERYAEIIEAYQSGLAEFATAGGKLKTVNSVASFFVSRVDTEVDPRLEKIGTPEALALRGKTAIANARAAYGLFLDRFRSEEWLRLGSQAAGSSGRCGRPRRPRTLHIPTRCMSPNWWHRTPSTPCRSRRSTATRTMVFPFRSRLDPARSMPPSVSWPSWRRSVSTWTTSTRVLEEQGVEKFAKSWEDVLIDEKKRARLARPQLRLKLRPDLAA